MRGLLILVALSVACGDGITDELCASCGDDITSAGAALGPAHDLFIVAHQDDDVLFMQPDLLEAVRGGAGVTTVYVTAGNGTKGAWAADIRYLGLEQAYAEAAGDDNWNCGWIEIAGHAAEHCRLAKGVSLVFLGYPDGGKQGQEPNSLLHLWGGTSAGADTIAGRVAHYDRDGLVATLAEVIERTSPATIHTLEVAATHGRDHADHMIVGALAVVAAAQARSSAELISYRGYNTTLEQPNKLGAIFTQAAAMVDHYEACTTSCGCGRPCGLSPAHAAWLHRRYAVGFRSRAAGQLRAGDACLVEGAGGALAFGDCTTAPRWELEAGVLRDDAGCVTADATGALAIAACTGAVAQRWFLDDEGHLWSGLPPPAMRVTPLAHLSCLAPGSDGPELAVCGVGNAPTWSFTPTPVVTPRASLGLIATGRAVRIGDLTGDGLGDLCGIDDRDGALLCAPGDGTGRFLPAVRIDDPTAPLAIDADSLAIGDVDGDGLADACGRDAAGLVCARAARGFAAERWSTAFGDADARPGTGPSLAIVDGRVCGLGAAGVECVAQGEAPVVRSTWPAADALVWPVDLDGDGEPDWCASSPLGTACGLAAHARFSAAGAPWVYSQGGVLDDAVADLATVGYGDIDGNGRADLCSLDGDRITCARSQRRGFGPRATLAVLPGLSPNSLWLGDLDGDSISDLCVSTPTTITCLGVGLK